MSALISCSCPNAENSPDLNTRTAIRDFWVSMGLGRGASAAHSMAGKAITPTMHTRMHTRYRMVLMVICALQNKLSSCESLSSKDLAVARRHGIAFGGALLSPGNGSTRDAHLQPVAVQ